MTYGHYVINQHPDGSSWVLGRGGMGVTFKATDTNLQCPVALKIISPQSFGGEYSERRFLREARLAAQIRHPNVAAIHHLDHEKGQYFYAMEFVDGITAEKWVQQQGRMSPELALDIVMQIARALTAADRHKVVHRDIKPGNIMILPDPANRSRVIAKLIDFGLARACTGEATPTATTCGFTGTPQFASPEQAENLELDVRSDIYSLGSTLWYLLVGEAPFVGTPARIIAQLLTSEPPWDRVKHLSKDITRLLRSMLAKEPGNRIQTPVELHDEISRCREKWVARNARAKTAPRESQQNPTENYALPAAAFAGVMVLILVWIALSPRPHEEVHLPPVAFSRDSGMSEPPAARKLPASPAVSSSEAHVAKTVAAKPAGDSPSDVSPNAGLTHPAVALEAADPAIDSPVFTQTLPDTNAAVGLNRKEPVSLTLGGLASDDPATKAAAALASTGVTSQTRNSDQQRGDDRKRTSRQRHASPWQALDGVRGSLQGFVRSLF
jgi:serine/threonine protein kinase